MDVHRIQADFDRIANIDQRSCSGSDRHDRYLLSLVPFASTTVLEVGCGSGRLSALLAAHGAHVTGVDLSPRMVQRARELRAESGGLEFICGDFLQLPLQPEGFDCVISAAALHHMPLEPAVVKMRNLVRSGGRLIIHDLRASNGLVDDLRGATILARDALARMSRLEWPVRPRAVRQAWAAHGRNDTYLNQSELGTRLSRLLPECTLVVHWDWRYTVTWDRSAAA